MKAIVTVIGKDRVGIIAEVCALLAKNDVNVLDISQTILKGYFTMVMMVDTSGCKMAFSELSKLLQEEGEHTGLSVRIQREDIFEAMHRI
ncbi:MAG: ACT domain-containing protein [Oscillospiraceae bacterium]|nr:ACT domain-containing protein [Oscillospiraceae bacterium]